MSLRAGAGGPSSQARQSEGQAQPGPRPGALTGGYRVGAPGEAGPMAAEAALRLVFLGLSASPAGRGRWRVGGAGAERRVRPAAARMSARRPARSGVGALPLPRAPLEAGPTPTPAWTRGNTCVLGAGRGRGRWGRIAPAAEGASVLLEGSWMCSEDTSAERRGGRGGTSTHSVWPLGGREEPAVSLRAWRAPRGGRVVLIRLPLPGSGSGAPV